MFDLKRREFMALLGDAAVRPHRRRVAEVSTRHQLVCSDGVR
jgi:hypothetical protein